MVVGVGRGSEVAVKEWGGKGKRGGGKGLVRGCSVLRERGVAHEQLLARRQVELALGREARVQVHLVGVITR